MKAKVTKLTEVTIGDAFLKRSAKLIPCQKEMIVWWRNKGSTLRELAAMFHVSKRTIQFVLDPDKLSGNLLARKLRGGEKQYYDRESHNAVIKETRKYKKQLFGKLKIKS